MSYDYGPLQKDRVWVVANMVPMKATVGIATFGLPWTPLLIGYSRDLKEKHSEVVSPPYLRILALKPSAFKHIL